MVELQWVRRGGAWGHTRSSTRLANEWRHPTVGALLQHPGRHQSSSAGQARRDSHHVSPALPISSARRPPSGTRSGSHCGISDAY